MIAKEKVKHLKQMLDEADVDPAKRQHLGQRLFHAAGRLARANKSITAEMVAEELTCKKQDKECEQAS